MRAGLIPSRALQEGRIIHERQTDPQTVDGQYAIIRIFIVIRILSNLNRTGFK